MFENVVAFLTAYAGNEDFTRALDANKASEGDDEEAMKVPCMFLTCLKETFRSTWQPSTRCVCSNKMP